MWTFFFILMFVVAGIWGFDLGAHIGAIPSVYFLIGIEVTVVTCAFFFGYYYSRRGRESIGFGAVCLCAINNSAVFWGYIAAAHPESLSVLHVGIPILSLATLTIGLVGIVRARSASPIVASEPQKLHPIMVILALAFFEDAGRWLGHFMAKMTRHPVSVGLLVVVVAVLALHFVRHIRHTSVVATKVKANVLTAIMAIFAAGVARGFALIVWSCDSREIWLFSFAAFILVGGAGLLGHIGHRSVVKNKKT